MQRQQISHPVLPARVSLSKGPAAVPAVRFGEGFIAPKIAMHHAREARLPSTVSHRTDAPAPAVRFGEGFIAPKVAMHHAREIR